jgi:hypothetical protein
VFCWLLRVCPADYKSRIVQRGGVPPLIRMLSSTDLALKEMAAFALGRLAQNTHNQAGIVQVGSSSDLSCTVCNLQRVLDPDGRNNCAGCFRAK